MTVTNVCIGKIRHNITSCAVNLPGYVGRKATIAMYKAARRFIDLTKYILH